MTEQCGSPSQISAPIEYKKKVISNRNNLIGGYNDLSKEKNPDLKKYADKIRALAKDISLDEETPDKYLEAIADAVENNRFQLSATIEGLVNTRKDLLTLHRAVVGDILTINQQLEDFNKDYAEFRTLAEQNINATTLFHQNMTDLLIAYFGVPKGQQGEEEEAKIPEQKEEQKEEAENWPPDEQGVPEIADSEETENPYVPEEPKQTENVNTQVNAEVSSEVPEEIPEGVEEFKPKGKKNV